MTSDKALCIATRAGSQNSYLVFNFGKYKDVPIKDIPIDYLDWIISNFGVTTNVGNLLLVRFAATIKSVHIMKDLGYDIDEVAKYASFDIDPQIIYDFFDDPAKSDTGIRKRQIKRR